MDTWIITIITLIASTAISAIVSTAVKRAVDKKMDKSLNEQKELIQYREEHEDRELDEKIGGTLRKELKPISEKIDALSVLIKLNQEGTITLLRESMKQSRDEFVKKEFATASEVASWHELYNTYKKLGGNHFAEYVDAWKEDIDDLPREPPEEIEEEK